MLQIFSSKLSLKKMKLWTRVTYLCPQREISAFLLAFLYQLMFDQEAKGKILGGI